MVMGTCMCGLCMCMSELKLLKIKWFTHKEKTPQLSDQLKVKANK